ncbi:MAG: DUF983 domain-containing protein [Hyphomicrobiaceae bacterium]
MPIAYSRTPEVERPRPVGSALWAGFRGRCPSCGRGRLFRAFLKVADQCPSCGTELHHHRADDAPPYFVILIVGHVIVSLVLMVEMRFAPPLWAHVAIWVPLTFAMALVLLPRVKGALVGLQWALRMHGFSRAAMPERLDRYGAPAEASQAET